MSGRLSIWAALVVLPLVGLWVLLAAPRLDVQWEHHPAHFWLVLAAAVVNAALALATSEAARRRSDARVFLVSLAFLASGFLALHALATPGVLLEGKNAGFTIATPVGLLAAACFLAASSLDFGPERAAAALRRRVLLRGGLLAVMAAWAGVSLAAVPPLDEPLPEEVGTKPLIALAAAGLLLYGTAAARYYDVYRRAPAFLLVAASA